MLSVISLHTVKWSNKSFWSVDGTLICTTTPGKSELRTHGNERMSQSYRTKVSPSDGLMSYQNSYWVRVLPICSYAVRLFYISSQFGSHILGLIILKFLVSNFILSSSYIKIFITYYIVPLFFWKFFYWYQFLL